MGTFKFSKLYITLPFYIGKAIDKQCNICSKIIKGSNWSRHAKTHTKVNINIKLTCRPITNAKLKKGRPVSLHKLDTTCNIRVI
jgi:hypothetical protein